MFAIAQTRIGNDAIEKEDQRGAAGIRVIQRADEHRSRHGGFDQCGFQPASERVGHPKNRIGAHAALLVCVNSISMGGMPSLASSAPAACAMCSMLICEPA